MSTLNKGATEEEDVEVSLGSLKLRNSNCLIFGQTSVNSIRNKFAIMFFLVSNNIYVLLISEAKIDGTFPVIESCVPGCSVPL